MNYLVKSDRYVTIASLSLLLLSPLNIVTKVNAQESPVEEFEYHDKQTTDRLVQQAELIVTEFSGQLKTALVGAIQAKGFYHAVNKCKTEAPKIAKQLSKDGWHIARTSLKTRNSTNQADAWETETLKSFDAAYKGGSAAQGLTATILDGETFRYMKAIPTGQVCLACHGQQIAPKLQQAINAEYPEDKATGFTLEDIRGAFTLSKNLKQ